MRASDYPPCFARCIADLDTAELGESALLEHHLRHWVCEGILRSTQRARGRIFAIVGAAAASARIRPQADFTDLLAARLDRGGLALAALRMRAVCWAEEDSEQRVTDRVCGARLRAEVPESVRHSMLRTAVNGWCTSRRFDKFAVDSCFGCGAEASDIMEHYVFALRPLRLDIRVFRGGGIASLLPWLAAWGATAGTDLCCMWMFRLWRSTACGRGGRKCATVWRSSPKATTSARQLILANVMGPRRCIGPRAHAARASSGERRCCGGGARILCSTLLFVCCLHVCSHVPLTRVPHKRHK